MKRKILILPLLFLLTSCSNAVAPTTTTTSVTTSQASDIISVNISENFDEKEIRNETVNIKSLSELPSKLVKDGYHLTGVFKDNKYKEYYDFRNESKTYNLYVKYEKLESPKKDQEINLTSYIDSLLTKTDSYIPYWNKESFKGRWNYIDGVFLNSIVNLYKKTNNNKYKDFFINYINYYINEDGTFIYYNKDKKIIDNNEGFKEGELDTICESKILFDAYELTNDERYLTAIEYTYNKLKDMPKAQNSENYWHKTSYENQIWLDGMYMYAPFLARYAKMKNDSSIFNTIKRQYEYIYTHMRDTNGLLYHGYDTTKTIFWSKDNNGNSKSIWLRSMGWYMVSLVDILEYFPEGDDKVYLKTILEDALTNILKYQDETTKMFYQVVDKKEETILIDSSYFTGLKNTKYGNVKTCVSNYLESSGSSMVSYTLMKYGRLYQDSNTFEAKGKEVFEGIYSKSFKNDILNDICITAGLGPDNKKYRDGSIAYYLAEPVGSDDAKGVGPFIMAYLEYNN